MSSGGRQPVPTNRRLVLDLLHFARQLPMYPLERTFDLRVVADARERTSPKVSWAVLFLKAYGLLSANKPQLRQTYLRWPWPYVYEHPRSIGMLSVNRRDGDAQRICWARFAEPERQSLAQLQGKLDAYKREPIAKMYRRQLCLSRFPTPLRRLALWMSLNLSGDRRSRRLGTFGMSTLASYGAVNRYYPSCLTTNITYGPIDEQGRALVTVVYDHRLIDGAPLAEALAELEAILQGPIVRELAELSRVRQAA
jgi:hypothetical protein